MPATLYGHYFPEQTRSLILEGPSYSWDKLIQSQDYVRRMIGIALESQLSALGKKRLLEFPEFSERIFNMMYDYGTYNFKEIQDFKGSQQQPMRGYFLRQKCS